MQWDGARPGLVGKMLFAASMTIRFKDLPGIH
jgi:hypothetical protein